MSGRIIKGAQVMGNYNLEYEYVSFKSIPGVHVITICDEYQTMSLELQATDGEEAERMSDTLREIANKIREINK